MNNLLVVFVAGNFFFGPSAGPNEVWVLSHANGLGGTPAWSPVPTSGAAPSINEGQAAVYDPITNRLIVHGGGAGSTSPVLSGVYVLSNANGLGGPAVWSKTTTNLELAREGQTAVYDAPSDQLIVFGGDLCFYGTAQNDTWLLENASGTPSTWVSAATTGGPPAARTMASGVYDSADSRLIVFGGSVLSPYPDDVRLNDTWVLSNATGTGGTPVWQHLSTVGSPPPVRYAHSAVYNPTNNTMLIFGGRSAGDVFLNDLWQLSNANGTGGQPEWTQLPQTGSPPGIGQSRGAAFDAANQRMIVYGGYSGPPTNAPESSVWVLDLLAQPDSSAPTTTASVTGTAGANNWYTSAVQVTLSATDPDGSADVAATYFTIDGGSQQTYSGPFNVTADGVHNISFWSVDHAGNAETAESLAVKIDQVPPTITITAPTAGPYLLNQAVAADFSAADATSGVATLTGAVPGGSNIDTSSVGAKTLTVTATDVAGNTATAAVTYTVSYAIVALYDQTKAVKSGATIPIKLQITDANGANVSASGIVVHATGVVLVSTNAPGVLEDAGNANPDSDFRYDPTIGTTGGYIFNLNTTGYATGTFNLSFTAGADPTVHVVGFQVK